MTDEQTESFLVLKYGNLNKAYHTWINMAPWSEPQMTLEEDTIINEFFAIKSLRERLELSNHTV